MKRTSLSRSGLAPLALRFTATECHDGKLELWRAKTSFSSTHPFMWMGSRCLSLSPSESISPRTSLLFMVWMPQASRRWCGPARAEQSSLELRYQKQHFRPPPAVHERRLPSRIDLIWCTHGPRALASRVSAWGDVEICRVAGQTGGLRAWRDLAKLRFLSNLLAITELQVTCRIAAL